MGKQRNSMHFESSDYENIKHPPTTRPGFRPPSVSDPSMSLITHQLQPDGPSVMHG